MPKMAVWGHVFTIIMYMVFTTFRATFETGEYNTPVKVVLIQFLAGTTSALCVFIARPVSSIMGKSDEISLYDPQTLLGCFMAGLVSVSASCRGVTKEAGILIGMAGSFFFMFAKKLMLKFEVDDGLNQVGIHCVCGCWALIAAGFFDSRTGVFVTGNMAAAWNQLIGIGAIFLLAFVPTYAFFFTL
jgi:Amt family ammonium transporter